MMKKLLPLLALLFAFSLIAAACGSDDDESSDDTTDTTEATDDESSDDATDTTEATDDGSDDGAAAPGDGLVIGAVLPETGALAFLGPPMIESVGLAGEDLAAAGADVTIVSGDSGTDGAVAQETVDRLLGEGAQSIVGAAASGVSQDIIQGLFDASIAQCTGSATSPAFTGQENATYFFRTVPPDNAVAPIIADTVAADSRTNVAIVARADDYGTALSALVAEELTGLGIDNVEVSYDPENVAADSVVGEVASSGADSVVLIGFDEAVPIIQAALEAGVAPDVMYGADGLFFNTLNELVDPENPNVIDGFKLIGASGGQEFNERLTELTEGNLIYGGQMYDCVILQALAFAQTGSTSGDDLVPAAIEISREDDGDTTCTSYEECAAAIEAGEGVNYDGAAGPIELDDGGDPTVGRYAIVQFSDGEMVPLDSQDVDLGF